MMRHLLVRLGLMGLLTCFAGNFVTAAVAQTPNTPQLQNRLQKFQSNRGGQVLITANEVSYDPMRIEDASNPSSMPVTSDAILKTLKESVSAMAMGFQQSGRKKGRIFAASAAVKLDEHVDFKLNTLSSDGDWASSDG